MDGGFDNRQNSGPSTPRPSSRDRNRPLEYIAKAYGGPFAFYSLLDDYEGLLSTMSQPLVDRLQVLGSTLS